MKIVDAGHEYMSHKGLTGYEFIEKIGRTCYKSEDKITKGSAEKFVKGLKDRRHWAILEHEPVYFLLEDSDLVSAAYYCFDSEKYIDVKEFEREGTDYVSAVVVGNLRSFYECLKTSKPTIEISVHEKEYMEKSDSYLRAVKKNNFVVNGSLLYSMINMLYTKYSLVYDDIWEDCVRDIDLPLVENGLNLVSGEELENDLKDSHPDVLKSVLRRTVKFTCDRGTTHDLVRHRPSSYAQESTRYCNYTKGKFGGELSFIKPCFWNDKSPEYMIWYQQMQNVEKAYRKLMIYGAKPQEARSVLPNSLKADIIITTTEDEWQHIVNLRYLGTTGAPHPQMVEIMEGWAKELHELSNGRVHI